MNIYKLVLGDRSGDGHGSTITLTMAFSHSMEEMQEAYKKSCELTGLQFHKRPDFTGHEPNPWSPEAENEYRLRKLFVEFGDRDVSAFAKDTLATHGLDLSIFPNIGRDSFVPIFLAFIKLSLPELEWETIEEIPTFEAVAGSMENLAYGMFE